MGNTPTQERPLQGRQASRLACLQAARHTYPYGAMVVVGLGDLVESVRVAQVPSTEKKFLRRRAVECAVGEVPHGLNYLGAFPDSHADGGACSEHSSYSERFAT